VRSVELGITVSYRIRIARVEEEKRVEKTICRSEWGVD
jgi:hypothetical protein